MERVVNWKWNFQQIFPKFFEKYSAYLPQPLCYKWAFCFENYSRKKNPENMNFMWIFNYFIFTRTIFSFLNFIQHQNRRVTSLDPCRSSVLPYPLTPEKFLATPQVNCARRDKMQRCRLDYISVWYDSSMQFLCKFCKFFPKPVFCQLVWFHHMLCENFSVSIAIFQLKITLSIFQNIFNKHIEIPLKGN